MTKKQSTKRALLASALSLLLCISMLIGTTFAWFTDSVTSGRNTIQSGNLDVELYYSVLDASGNWTTYDKVTKDTKIFDYNLWEPGYTSVAKFKIANEGSLALKYQLTADVYNETPGKTKDGADIKLSDHIKYGVTEDLTVLENRAAAAAVATNDFDSFTVKSAALTGAAGDKEIEVGMVIAMPTTVGNEANHDGTHIPTIEFGINLLATQLTYESDSFNDQYDVDAFYADYYVRNNKELTAAIADAEGGEIVALYAGNYTMPMNDDWYVATKLPANMTFVGVEDGVKLTPVPKGQDVGEQGRIFADGYTFEKITFTNTVSPSGYGKFVDCVFEGYNGLRHGAYKNDTNFVNCVFNNANGWAFHTEYLYDADIYFENCRFNGLVEFTDTISDVNKVYFNGCAFIGTNRYSSGKVFYAWKNNAVLTDCAGYDAALFAGCTAEGASTYVSVADASTLSTALATENNTVLLDAGNYGACPKLAAGATVIGVDGTVFENNEGDALPRGLSDVTFENITVRGKNAVSWGSVKGDVVFKDCTIDSGLHIDSSANGKKILFEGCTITEMAYLKLGGAADYYMNDCIIEKISPKLTTPWGREFVIFYGDITLTNCQINRLLRAGSSVNVTVDSCTYNGADVVDDSVIYKYNGVNYNNPNVTIK